MGSKSPNTDPESTESTAKRLFEDVQKVVAKATEIISETVEQEVDNLRELEEKAVTKADDAFTTFRGKLKEIGKQGETARACIEKMESDLQDVQTNMRNSLADCYRKHYTALDQYGTERANIHNEAKKLQQEAQTVMQNCLTSRDKLKCIQAGILELGKKSELLFQKFQQLVTDEVEERKKCAKLIIECDQRVIKDAHERYARVIEEIKKCVKK